jgi:hypothetical protein
MNSAALIARLRALADEIEKGGKHVPAPAPAAEPPSQFGARTVECEVGYWKVGPTKTGKTMGSLSPRSADGEAVYWKCFDENVLAKVDPLNKGEKVRVTLVPWNDTHRIVEIVRLSAAAAPERRATGITVDEIPF